MPFEISPRKEIEKKNWLDFIFYFSLILFLITVLSYFILDVFLKKTSGDFDVLKQKITQRTEEEETLEKDLLLNKKKIDDFSIILNKHILSSQVFSFIEKLTHPKVFFKDFIFTADQANLRIPGQTQDFKTLGEQILIFQKEQNIKNVNLSNLSLTEDGKITFTLDIFLNPEVFILTE